MVGVLNCLDKASWVPHLSVFCVMGYIVGFAIGPGPVPWIWNTEFFQQSARAGGASKCLFRCSIYSPFAQLFPALFAGFVPISLDNSSHLSRWNLAHMCSFSSAEFVCLHSFILKPSCLKLKVSVLSKIINSLSHHIRSNIWKYFQSLRRDEWRTRTK